MPPSSAESSQPDPQEEKPIEMPRFRWSPPPADPSVRRAPASVPANDNRPSSLLKKPEARSSPLPWPPTHVQELNKRRMSLQEEREQRSAAVAPTAESTAKQPARGNHEASEPQLDEVKTLTTPLTSSASPGDTVAPVSLSGRLRTIAGRGARCAQVAMSTSRQWASDRQSGFTASVTALKERIRIASRTAALARTVRAVNTKSNESEAAHAAVPSTHIEAVAGAATPTRSASFHSRGLGVTGYAQKVWARCVPIAIGAGKQAQGAATGIRSLRDGAAARLRTNERLATSMSMAVLSALLALGLIIAIMHHPSASGPVRSVSLDKPATQEKRVAQPAATVNSAGDSARAPNRAGAVGTAGKSGARMSVVTAASLTVSTKRTPARKSATHRAHRNSDEDYVAPNTYVVVGRR